MSDAERAIVGHLTHGGDPLFRDWRVAGKNGPGTCYECGQPATKQECHAGEPWIPFCKAHGLSDCREHSTMAFWQPKERRRR